jgi:hypothetical protein
MLQQQQQDLAEVGEEFNDAPPLSRNQDRGLRLRLKQARAEVSTYESAFEAAKAAAEQKCSGQTFTSAAGRAPLDQVINRADALEDLLTENESHKEEIGLAREWVSQIPEDAPTARTAAGWFIEDLEQRLADFDADYDRLVRR